MQIPHDVLAGSMWNTVAKQWSVSDMKGAVESLLDAALKLQEYAEEDRPNGVLPHLEAAQDRKLESLSYAADCLEDSDLLMQGLPQDLMNVASYPATFLMTGYEAC